jgi:hypothetical protein
VDAHRLVVRLARQPLARARRLAVRWPRQRPDLGEAAAQLQADIDQLEAQAAANA